MAFTYGFYNSENKDRPYDAIDMSEIFEGVILDGVLPAVGTRFQVLAHSPSTVTVGTGRAWFNLTWNKIKGDPVELPLPAPDDSKDRYDAVVLEVDRRKAVRKNRIFIKTGVASDSPVNPAMTNIGELSQHPLAYIRRAAGIPTIQQSDITSSVGTTDCPYASVLVPIKYEGDGGGSGGGGDIVIPPGTDISGDLASVLSQMVNKERVERILLHGFVDGREIVSDDELMYTATSASGETLVRELNADKTVQVSTYSSSTGELIGKMTKRVDGQTTSYTVEYGPSISTIPTIPSVEAKLQELSEGCY